MLGRPEPHPNHTGESVGLPWAPVVLPEDGIILAAVMQNGWGNPRGGKTRGSTRRKLSSSLDDSLEGKRSGLNCVLTKGFLGFFWVKKNQEMYSFLCFKKKHLFFGMMKSPKWMWKFLGGIDGHVNPGNLEPTRMSHDTRLGHGFSNEKW